MNKSTLLYIYASLIFILFFDLWVENSVQASNFFGSWVKPFIDEPNFSLVWTVLALVALIVLFKYILDVKEQEKNELKKTLDSEMGILIMSNRELNRYRLQDNILMILNRFVQQNSYVSAAQWYHYVENNNQGLTKFKFNFQYGSVAEEANLNAVQQIYYQCDTSTLRAFRIAKQVYTSEGNPDSLVDFIIDAHDKLATKKKDLSYQEDAVLCSLMLISFEIIEKDFGLVFEDFSGPNTERVQELIDNSRTGILRAALMEDEYYSFTHTKDNEKFNRQYVARLVKVKDENIIFTIVLDSSILEEREYETKMFSIATDFEVLLKDLEKMYNENNERIGGA